MMNMAREVRVPRKTSESNLVRSSAIKVNDRLPVMVKKGKIDNHTKEVKNPAHTHTYCKTVLYCVTSAITSTSTA